MVNKSWALNGAAAFWWGIVLGVGYLIWDALKQPSDLPQDEAKMVKV